MKLRNLTQKRAKELFRYEPSTGRLFWVRGRPGTAAGSEAGNVSVRRNGLTKYRMISIDGEKYLAHHVVWLIAYGRMPKYEIDHQDHNGLNNRLKNLKDAPHKFNQRNQSIQHRRKGEVMGVRKRKDCNRWETRIRVDGRDISLGFFTNKVAAIKVRKSAEQKYGFHKNHGRKK